MCLYFHLPTEKNFILKQVTLTECLLCARFSVCFKVETRCNWPRKSQVVVNVNACNTGDLGSIPGLGRSPEEDMATHSSILAWRIPMDRGSWQVTIHGVAKSQTRLSD